MLEFDQIFNPDERKRVRFITHHNLDLNDYEPEEVFGGDKWFNLTDRENYEHYKIWYRKTFSKLGQALS